MTDTLMRDSQAIDRALRAAPDAAEVQVDLVLPRKVAEAVRELLRVHMGGGEALIVPTHSFFTPTEAAEVLGVSRPTVYKFMDSGRLDFVPVGTHRRIPAEALSRFRIEEGARRDQALDELAAFSNEHGLVD